MATSATDDRRTLRRQDIRRLRTVVKRSEERKRGADRSRSERSEDGKPPAGGRSPPVRVDATPTTSLVWCKRRRPESVRAQRGRQARRRRAQHTGAQGRNPNDVTGLVQEAPTGVEPVHGGFADLCLTT